MRTSEEREESDRGNTTALGEDDGTGAHQAGVMPRAGEDARKSRRDPDETIVDEWLYYGVYRGHKRFVHFLSLVLVPNARYCH
jgi:hypothetical protein